MIPLWTKESWEERKNMWNWICNCAEMFELARKIGLCCAIIEQLSHAASDYRVASQGRLRLLTTKRWQAPWGRVQTERQGEARQCSGIQMGQCDCVLAFVACIQEGIFILFIQLYGNFVPLLRPWVWFGIWYTAFRVFLISSLNYVQQLELYILQFHILLFYARINK